MNVMFGCRSKYTHHTKSPTTKYSTWSLGCQSRTQKKKKRSYSISRDIKRTIWKFGWLYVAWLFSQIGFYFSPSTVLNQSGPVVLWNCLMSRRIISKSQPYPTATTTDFAHVCAELDRFLFIYLIVEGSDLRIWIVTSQLEH